MKRPHSSHWASGLAASASIGVLTACGGGGDSSSLAGPPTPASLTVSGTAATGAALAGATIDIRCASGTASTATAADGNFSATIAAGALPCVVRATSGPTVLHSATAGSGITARANVTPVTELMLARLAGVLPADYYAAFGAAAAAALTTAAVNDAAVAVTVLLEGNGVSFAGVGDTVAGPLIAAHGAVVGDAYDRALDALRAAQTSSGTSLAVLAQAVALGSPSASPANRTTTASLPPERLLADSASNCGVFRSGQYRLIVGEASATPAQAVVVFKATTLTLRDLALATSAVLTPTGPCTYLHPSGGELAVSRSGVVIGRVTGPDLQPHPAIAIPEQAHGLSELAGVWNYVTLEGTAANGSPHLTAGTFTFDGQGRATAQEFCEDMKTCATVPTAQVPAMQVSLNATGGFDVAVSGATHRLFAYRAGGGEMMLVQVASSGRVAYYTRKAPAVLPPLGRTQELMNVFVSSLYTVPAALSASKSTITSVDASLGSYGRAAVQNFLTGATRPETLVINSPREGYIRRNTGGAVHTDGSASTVAEFVSLAMRGMDVGVLGLTQSNQLGISTPIVSSTP